MYKRTIWVDHIEGVQEGTDMNAANFNNIEAGTMEANALAALNAEYQRYCADQAKNNEVVGISAFLEGNSVHTIEIPEKYARNTDDYRLVPVLERPNGNGTVGDIIIMEKQIDNFSVHYEGTAEGAFIIFYISGGMI